MVDWLVNQLGKQVENKVDWSTLLLGRIMQLDKQVVNKICFLTLIIRLTSHIEINVCYSTLTPIQQKYMNNHIKSYILFFLTYTFRCLKTLNIKKNAKFKNPKLQKSKSLSSESSKSPKIQKSES